MSTTFKWATIVAKAKENKARVEKEHKLKLFDGCNTAETVYIFNKAVLNPGKDVTLTRNYSNCKEPTGTGINKTLKKSQYKDCSSRLIKFMEDKSKGYKAPNYITFGSEKISVRLSAYICSKIILYYNNHTRLPDEVKVQNSVFYSTTSNSTSSSNSSSSSTSSNKIFTSSPHYTDYGCNRLGQCTPYYCAPHSIHQILKKFGITQFTEGQLAGWCGTTSSGTSHSGIETCIATVARKIGKKIKVTWYNFSDFGNSDSARWKAIGQKMAKSNVGILWHLWYSGAGSYVDYDACGHYEVLQKINLETNYCKALNSLGSRCGGSSYCGHLQDRKLSVQKQYLQGISQKSVCVITLE